MIFLIAVLNKSHNDIIDCRAKTGRQPEPPPNRIAALRFNAETNAYKYCGMNPPVRDIVEFATELGGEAF